MTSTAPETISRRQFLKRAAVAAGGMMIPLAALEFLSPARAKILQADKQVRWVFLVDTTACVGCGLCVKACKLENGIPYDAPVTRTWVERYVITKDGELHADSPQGGRDGFVSPQVYLGKGAEQKEPVQLYEGEREDVYQDIDSADIEKAFFVPKLCNQCANPPCVQVCPVGATYQTPDGVALVDRSWCIGCGYCIMACPYGARFFNPHYRTAEKCTFCYHRITKGLPPACVQACPFGARQIGNMKDSSDPVTRAILTERVAVLKSEFGTKPQAYYIGLDWEVR
jgi:tetrathionate reductase subunit B